MSYHEKTLVMHRSEIPPDWLAEKVALTTTRNDFERALNRNVVEWQLRATAETDESCKQFIPYGILCTPAGLLAAYPRKGSEKRLHNLWSIGVGGHPSPEDAADGNQGLPDVLQAALLREIQEEFRRPPRLGAIDLLGIINEEETPVGRVHLGVVFLVKVDQHERALPAAELEGLQWLPTATIVWQDFEIWSRLAARLLAANSCAGGQR